MKAAESNNTNNQAQKSGRELNPPKPIVVAGMHRSGTSLFASLLSASGVNMGSQFVAPDAANPRGYFEDLAIVELNRQMLLRGTPDTAGHRDWGWTTCERLDQTCFAESRDAAKALIATRNTCGAWGWKDPRTTITLDFWHELLIESGCDPFYIFLYRFPWDVADSMQRLGADVFLSNPEYANQIWSFYNDHLLCFYRQHRDRCLLLSSNAIWHAPERLCSLLTERLGIELGSTFESTSDSKLWRARGGADPLVTLMAATSPACLMLLSELDNCADLSAAELWAAPRTLRLQDRGKAGPSVDLSIIVPCHNHGEFLIDAIASAERFLPDRSELIIVNDGSDQPRTVEVLEAMRKLGYSVIDQPHSGLSAARNRGIASASGRYILPLDADNRICAGIAEKAIGILDTHSTVGVVYGNRFDFGKRNGLARVHDFDLNTMLLGNYIDACGVYRRALWSDCGGYDEGLSAWEDWEFWIAAAERGWHFHRLDTIAFEYRVRPESLVSSTLVPETWSRLHAHILQKHSTLFLHRIPEIVLGLVGPQTPAQIPPLESLTAGWERLLSELEGDRANWMVRAGAAESNLAERERFSREMEEDRSRWMVRAATLEYRLKQQETHLRQLETDLSERKQHCSEVQEELLAQKGRFSELALFWEQRERELAAIRCSATWRWSRKILDSTPIRRLFGPAIQAVSARSQRILLRRSVPDLKE
jgi:GT2 family glycosyltransferase